MAMQSNIHFYVNWAKERLDEMDAALTSLEGEIGGVQADARHIANNALADLRKSRDGFRDIVKKQAEASEAAWIGFMYPRKDDAWCALTGVQHFAIGRRAGNGPQISQFSD